MSEVMISTIIEELPGESAGGTTTYAEWGDRTKLGTTVQVSIFPKANVTAGTVKVLYVPLGAPGTLLDAIVAGHVEYVKDSLGNDLLLTMYSGGAVQSETITFTVATRAVGVVVDTSMTSSDSGVNDSCDVVITCW